MTVVVSLLAVVRKLGRRVAVAPWLAVGGSWVISQVVKRTVERARPPLASQLVHPSGYAFPSGHAIESIAVWGVACVVISLVLRRRARLAVRLVAAAVIVAVGVSRIYLGVHWTTDVIAAWILGGAWMATVIRGT
ncbi:MAG TPA: phosphatase PAP2 family protein [Acidimicrobiales bacterium]|nr:phosphatase PAP2 family protein [Acidimicrobiales bacterium]